MLKHAGAVISFVFTFELGPRAIFHFQDSVEAPSPMPQMCRTPSPTGIPSSEPHRASPTTASIVIAVSSQSTQQKQTGP